MTQTAAQALARQYKLFGCIQCGKCSGGCPVSLSIRRLIRETIVRDNLDLKRDDLWNCTACSTCTVRCPKELKPSDLVVGMRGLLIEEGRIGATIIEALESTDKYGNPWGRPRNKRTDWAAGLNVREVAAGEAVDVLYFVGCTPAYDSRVQNAARAAVACFQHLGADFGILGNAETCCGNEIRRMGEAGLFEVLRDENTKLFQERQIGRVVTTSPHCYNTFKNEYGEMNVKVQHSTQYLAELIDEGKLVFKGGAKDAAARKVVYHDPCFLGKQNKVFDEPRKILASVPGVELIEFDRSRERSLCCEGGGGRMWVESSAERERLAEVRVKDAAELGADVLATACPFCLLTLEDAVKTADLEGKLKIMDIMELVSEALQPKS